MASNIPGGQSSGSASNVQLKTKFQELHSTVVRTINPGPVIDFLFAKKVLGADELQKLRAVKETSEQCRELLTVLHASSHPEAFIQLRLAIKSELGVYTRLVTDLESSASGGEMRIIRIIQDKMPIGGVAKLGDEVYLLMPNKLLDQIAVYDANSFLLTRHICLTPQRAYQEIASCEHNRCLYISDRGFNSIHRYDQGNTGPTCWSVNDRPGGLSVTPDSTVLITCTEVDAVKEFSTHGEMIRQNDLDPGMVHPSHAIRLANGLFVVCHGDVNDPIHGISAVDTDGEIVLTYGGEPGSAVGRVNVPTHLGVDDTQQFIHVVDFMNRRVLVLNPEFAYVREVVSLDKWMPSKLCIDAQKRRQYVVEKTLSGSRLVVYQM